jgi:hypothetical protein
MNSEGQETLEVGSAPACIELVLLSTLVATIASGRKAIPGHGARGLLKVAKCLVVSLPTGLL